MLRTFLAINSWKSLNRESDSLINGLVFNAMEQFPSLQIAGATIIHHNQKQPKRKRLDPKGKRIAVVSPTVVCKINGLQYALRSGGVEIDPQTVRFFYALHTSVSPLLLAEKRAYDQAVVYLGDATAGLPQRSRIQYNLALLLKALNRNQETEAAPDNPDHLYALVVLYLE
jgi:hypothetical protein